MTDRTGTGDPTPHPYALMFPPMDQAEFDALVESIKDNGLRHPIIVNSRNQIVDGLNRFRACVKLDIQPKYDRRELSDGQVLILVIDNNVRRRHLSEAQRAAIAAKVRKGPANLPVSQEAAANMFNVSVRSIRSAEHVMELSTELHELMLADGVSVHAAENALKLPECERAQAIGIATRRLRFGRGRPKRRRALPRTCAPEQKKKTLPSMHGAYEYVFSALEDMPRLLVEQPLSPGVATDLLNELRKAIALLQSAGTAQ